jgi:hypothetical protein
MVRWEEVEGLGQEGGGEEGDGGFSSSLDLLLSWI